jgi:hypothetical protein
VFYLLECSGLNSKCILLADQDPDQDLMDPQQ